MVSIGQQLTCQRYIYKIRSSRLRKARWNLTLPLPEARKNDEVVSLADSQVLRWLDELNGIVDADEKARALKKEIRSLRRHGEGVAARRRINKLYAELDELQFKPDYVCVIMDRDKDYRRACQGFKINGLEYERLLGTNGGVKMKTIVFMAKRHIDEIRRRIDNGRDLTMPMVPAKLEAYKALSCSASTPVSDPHGVLVVPDCVTRFTSDIVYLNDENDGEPMMETRTDYPIELTESDGYGMMLPSLAERWSRELGLDYVAGGMNTRNSYEKGMVFAFDFVDFAEQTSHTYNVCDAWGNEVDIRDVELVLTTSMLKLWDSYPDCDTYLKNCAENGYSFCVTKMSPPELERERTTNYQFIQSYELSDEDIDRLIEPTMEEIDGILHADYAKTLLYLNGGWVTESNVSRLENDYIKALMIEPGMLDDPYVQGKIYHMIQNRINEAKVGVLNVHGNYSIVCGDPYALCQSIFGLPVTGLLKAGEIYNKYWCEQDSDSLACFRAPMTCHSNIRLVHPNRSPEAAYWYRYIPTCTLFNAWDTAAQALNGLDKDGDLVLLSNNEVLVSKLRQLPALMCIQRKAKKILVTEQDAVQSNIDSFGDDIGKTTNWITSMFEVQSHFPKDSIEYQTLAYRIQCGQLFQQNAIDKAKGIIAKPMPREWHDRHAAARVEDPERRELYRRIAADKKPYFMRYIYPSLSSQYREYTTNTAKNAMREFGMNVQELQQIQAEQLTERQQEFLYWYDKNMPVGTGDCVMNRICRKFEDRFDGYLSRQNTAKKFDYTIMKSGAEYTASQFSGISRLYQEYNKRMRSVSISSGADAMDEYEVIAKLQDVRDEFLEGCTKICRDRFTLCDIVLDLCYRKNSTKAFAWDMCGDEIIHNLLEHCDHQILFPQKDPEGDIVFGGERYSMHQTEVTDEYYSE